MFGFFSYCKCGHCLGVFCAHGYFTIYSENDCDWVRGNQRQSALKMLRRFQSRSMFNSDSHKLKRKTLTCSDRFRPEESLGFFLSKSDYES